VCAYGAYFQEQIEESVHTPALMRDYTNRGRKIVIERTVKNVRVCTTQLLQEPSGFSICTYVLVKQVNSVPAALSAAGALVCQYLYISTSKASKQSNCMHLPRGLISVVLKL